MDLPAVPLPPPLPTEPELRVIAGFWQRILAYCIDLLVLCAAGLALGFAFYAFWARLGGSARFIGFAIAFCYFGFTDSFLRKGQSLGKSVLGLKVVDRAGRPLSVGRALVRYFILELPFLLNGIWLSAGLNDWRVSFAVNALRMVWSSALIYLMVFNWLNRQGLHDWATGTFVVRRLPQGEFQPAKTWFGHGLIAIVIGLMGVGISALQERRLTRGFETAMGETLHQMQAMPDVSQADLIVGTKPNFLHGSTTQFVSADVWLRKRPDNYEYEQVASKVADTILRTFPPARRQDMIDVAVVYGFDLGIARWRGPRNFFKSPGQWEAEISR